MNRQNEIRKLLSTSAIPASVILHVIGDEIDFFIYQGEIMGLPVHQNTVFDCASLTKPLITTLLVLQEIEKGTITLESNLGDYDAVFPESLKKLPLVSLLTHSSGIRPWYPLYCESRSLAGYVNSISKLPFTSVPDSETHYSCLNFVLLSYLLLKVTGKGLPSLVHDRILKTLDLKRTGFHKSPVELSETAPAEYGDLFEQKEISKLGLFTSKRDGLIHGVVHDGNAFYCGSNSGNAGLFSIAEELVTIARQFTEDSELLDQNTTSLLCNYDTPWGPQRRTLGWQWASSPECSAGRTFPSHAIGHTGFTGISIWLDPEKKEYMVILTNRIHPRVTSLNMNEVRRRIHSIVRG